MSGRSEGFTLLEVLVAFTIMALTLGALLQVFGGGLRGSIEAREHTRAAFIAQSLIDGLDPDGLAQDGSTSGIFAGFYWELGVTTADEVAVPVDEEGADLRRATPVVVQALVRWGDPERSVQATTLRLRFSEDDDDGTAR